MNEERVLEYRKIIDNMPPMTGDLPKGIPKNIIFAGMGGSGIASDLIKDVVKDSLKMPIEISKSYNLPSYADSSTLFICTSYSGGTEETLTQFVEALKRRCMIITITSGGKLLEWSKRFNIPFIQLPAGMFPRDSLPYQFLSLTMILKALNIIDLSADIDEFLDELPIIDLKRIDEIAKSLKNKMPILYGSSEFSGVLRRIKSQINENGKMLAKFDELPELNHNEVVSFEFSPYIYSSAIFLIDEKDRPELKKRIEITKEIISNKVDRIHDIPSYGNSKLSRVMSLVYQGDYLSVKLSELMNIDRGQTKTIDKVKNDLKMLHTIEKLENQIESLVV